MEAFLAAKTCSIISSKMENILKPDKENKLESRCRIAPSSQAAPPSRRHTIVCTGASFVTTLAFNYGLAPSVVWAEDKLNGQEEDDTGVVGAIKSLLDPNEKTKSGKVLPKAYLKSAREVVKTLRESLKEDPNDIAKFRRTADAAKESIREYLSSWRGQQTVAQEESYVELERAIRSLASFYSKAGPSAPLPEEVKSEILNDLNTAEGFFVTKHFVARCVSIESKLDRHSSIGIQNATLLCIYPLLDQNYAISYCWDP